jgi:hypothetical protein
MTTEGGKKPMIRRVIAVSIFVAGLLIAGISQASSAIIETQHLIVSDATGNLSNAQLKSLADQAQAMVERILAFWSADPGIDRFGKIRVVFDVPRRDVYSSVFYWENKDGERIRIVRVFRAEGSPQMMAHKLTSAVFPLLCVDSTVTTGYWLSLKRNHTSPSRNLDRIMSHGV